MFSTRKRYKGSISEHKRLGDFHFITVKHAMMERSLTSLATRRGGRSSKLATRKKYHAISDST